MDDTYGNGGFNTNGDYSNDNSGSQRQQQSQTLTPVTIKQINEATQHIQDGEYQVHNVPLTHVSFVGIVRNVQDLTAKLSITIEDGTGVIDVNKWIQSHEGSIESTEEQNTYELNKYVYVTASLKEFNNKKQLQNATIKHITDHNEVIYHNLSAISNHLKAQGISVKQDQGKDSLFVKEGGNQTLSLADNILAVIKSNSESLQEGVPARLISQHLNISPEVVIKNCVSLIEEGKVYTGYDDNAYLAV